MQSMEVYKRLSISMSLQAEAGLTVVSMKWLPPSMLRSTDRFLRFGTEKCRILPHGLLKPVTSKRQGRELGLVNINNDRTTRTGNGGNSHVCRGSVEWNMLSTPSSDELGDSTTPTLQNAISAIISAE